MRMKYKLAILMSVLAAVALILLSFAQVGVNADYSELPPRPTGVPPNGEEQPADPPAVSHRGGFISLAMEASSPDQWVIVQWHDGKDTWYTVSGWQGNFNHEKQVLWWVAPEDMGKGPFRWVVLSGINGRQLAVSDSFYLPTHEMETVQIEIMTQTKP
jgi:hypothetical protein